MVWGEEGAWNSTTNTVVGFQCGLDTGLADLGAWIGGREGNPRKCPVAHSRGALLLLSEVGLEVGQRKKDSSTRPGLAEAQGDQP